MVNPLYNKPPKHVTDAFLCKNWSSLAYETRKHYCELADNSPTDAESDSQIDPTLKPTKRKPSTDFSSDNDIYQKRLKTTVPSSNSTQKCKRSIISDKTILTRTCSSALLLPDSKCKANDFTRLRTAAYQSTVALAPSLVKQKHFVPDIAEPVVRLVNMI
jgi:hypothetical protein